MAHLLDIIRNHIRPALHQRNRPRSPEERDRSARTGAHPDISLKILRKMLIRMPGGVHQSCDVLLHRGIRIHSAGDPLHPVDIRNRQRRRLLFRRIHVHPVEDPHLLFRRRIGDDLLEQKAVRLRLRQWIRPLLLNRVLRRNHQEHILRHPVCHAADRHLPLLHRLEHRRLRLRTRTVDLVE